MFENKTKGLTNVLHGKSENIAYITSLEETMEPEIIFDGLPPKTRVGDVVKKDEVGKILKAPDQSHPAYDVLHVLSAKLVAKNFLGCINDTNYRLFGSKFGIIECDYRCLSAHFLGVSEKDTVMVQEKNNTTNLQNKYTIARNLTKERELRDFLLGETAVKNREPERE